MTATQFTGSKRERRPLLQRAARRLRRQQGIERRGLFVGCFPTRMCPPLGAVRARARLARFASPPLAPDNPYRDKVRGLYLRLSKVGGALGLLPSRRYPLELWNDARRVEAFKLQ
jgi:hypothetical protein